MTGGEVLGDARSVLLVDYPSRDVPDTLARAGFTVFAHGGPGPEEYFAYELDGDRVVERRTGVRPERADLVYVHRPMEELLGIVEQASEMGARAVWCESGSDEAREIVERAGMTYVDAPRIVEAARQFEY